MTAKRSQHEVTTPAPRLPELVAPPAARPLDPGLISKILSRLDVIEESLGIDSSARKPHEPLPGSDVRPLTEADE